MEDPTVNKLFMSYAYYEDIRNIKIQWSEAVLYDTIVTIQEHDGTEFEVWLSTEDGGDHTFVKELQRRWETAKRESPNAI